MRVVYPYLRDLLDMGPTVVPYESMHLVLLDTLPHLWKLFSGLKLINKDEDEAYIMPKSTLALVGRDPRDARRTVPRAPTRSLRNINVHQKSLKAVKWMHFILCSGEVLRAGRLPRDFLDLFMSLCRACRFLFRPRGVSEAEINTIDDDNKYFVPNYYAKIYRGSVERLSLCLSTIATLLDVVLQRRACGPACVCRQFPMKWKIGALGKLIRSHSRPHSSLEANVTRQYEAELVTSLGEHFLPNEWAGAAGKHLKAPGLPRGSLKNTRGSWSGLRPSPAPVRSRQPRCRGAG